MGTENKWLVACGEWRAACLVLVALVAVGCESSVEMEPAAPTAPANTQAASTKPADEQLPERVRMDKPVREVKETGTYGGAIAGAYRSSRERIESLGVDQAIRFWQAEHGRYPKSHEEFMEKCWKPLNSPFPEIEEGYEYRYDPEDHAVYKVRIEETVEEESQGAADDAE